MLSPFSFQIDPRSKSQNINRDSLMLMSTLIDFDCTERTWRCMAELISPLSNKIKQRYTLKKREKRFSKRSMTYTNLYGYQTVSNSSRFASKLSNGHNVTVVVQPIFNTSSKRAASSLDNNVSTRSGITVGYPVNDWKVYLTANKNNVVTVGSTSDLKKTVQILRSGMKRQFQFYQSNCDYRVIAVVSGFRTKTEATNFEGAVRNPNERMIKRERKGQFWGEEIGEDPQIGVLKPRNDDVQSFEAQFGSSVTLPEDEARGSYRRRLFYFGWVYCRYLSKGENLTLDYWNGWRPDTKKSSMTTSTSSPTPSLGDVTKETPKLDALE
ncbi:hypothetical protein PROFUN_08368 [Planoprotostelium fungivorum]|uniref:Uncharacterized protein n=1 Tax=Planoprotostelium fungivorum TaxID=1890364 RepID=A0A2P6NJM7_9EUKA|nr:hypothetical protein PROFUN_08368 [Planoprotostelium fungivorum]